MIKMENKGKNPNTTLSFFEKKKALGRVKHAIIKMYFNAWFPIMAQSEYTMSNKIVMIDGFCGTGFYDETKEDGSPIVALKAVLNHNLKSNFKRKIELVFIDYDAKKTKELEKRVELVKAQFPDWQDYVIIRVITATFVSVIESITEDLDYEKVPILLFADPCGYSGDRMPMTSINKILSRKQCEAVINVHDGSANRFFRVISHEETITKFVGSTNWLKVRKKRLSPAEKLTIFINAYRKNLKSKHTLRFAMRQPSNRHKYDLVFATDHMKGIKAMKTAMAAHTHDMETLFFSANLSYRHVKIDTKSDEYKDYCAKETFQLIMSLYSGKEVFGAELEVFILKDTPYHFNFKPQLKSLFRNYIFQPVRNKSFNFLKFSIPNLCEDRAISARKRNENKPQSTTSTSSSSIKRTATGIKKKYTKTSTVVQPASNRVKRKHTKKTTTKEPPIEAKKRKYTKKNNSIGHEIVQNDTQSQTSQSTTTSIHQKRTREKSPQAGPSSALVQENIESQPKIAKNDSEKDVKTNTEQQKLDEVASTQSENQSPSNSANTQPPRNSRSRSKKPSKSITSAKDQPKITTFFTKLQKPE